MHKIIFIMLQVKLLQAQMYKRSFSMENISGIEEHSEFKEQNKSLKDQIQRYISRIAILSEKLNKVFCYSF